LASGCSLPSPPVLAQVVEDTLPVSASASYATQAGEDLTISLTGTDADGDEPGFYRMWRAGLVKNQKQSLCVASQWRNELYIGDVCRPSA
jgi:hypothetical protein